MKTLTLREYQERIQERKYKAATYKRKEFALNFAKAFYKSWVDQRNKQ